jgi:hypothetical protein
MSGRSHRSLRLGALALLAALAIWPRTRATTGTVELRAGAHAGTSTHGVAAHAETASAKLVSGPRTAKLTVVASDDSELKN